MRYILEVMRPVPLVVLDILDILTRIARHSTEACIQVGACMCSGGYRNWRKHQKSVSGPCDQIAETCITALANLSPFICSAVFHVSLQILDCPRLVETVITEFLPTEWDPRVAEPGQLLTSLHGVPCASAMKLLRVLASGSRNVAARLVSTVVCHSFVFP